MRSTRRGPISHHLQHCKTPWTEQSETMWNEGCGCTAGKRIVSAKMVMGMCVYKQAIFYCSTSARRLAPLGNLLSFGRHHTVRIWVLAYRTVQDLAAEMGCPFLVGAEVGSIHKVKKLTVLDDEKCAYLRPILNTTKAQTVGVQNSEESRPHPCIFSRLNVSQSLQVFHTLRYHAPRLVFL